MGEKSWTYKTTLPKAPSDDGVVTFLAFDGLDTFATVKLNGKVILESDNMSVPHRVDVTGLLEASTDNILEIDFASALLRAREIMAEHPDHKYVLFNGEPARLCVRKAQYHWGWDWGPVLMTAGPWRAVRLESYQSKIEDLWVEYDVDISSKAVKGTIFTKIENPTGVSVTVNVSLQDNVFSGSGEPDSDGLVKVDFKVPDVKLWYPHGYGAQPLYEFSVDLLAGEKELDSKTKKIGLRKVELVQEPDDIGKTFFFRINGVDVFCGGSDWIPADNFVPRITEEKYRKWIQMMVHGNQVMIRYASSLQP